MLAVRLGTAAGLQPSNEVDLQYMKFAFTLFVWICFRGASSGSLRRSSCMTTINVVQHHTKCKTVDQYMVPTRDM
jgi:hypothetical protein